MIGLGTLINVGAIIIGGLLGLFLGRSVKVRYQDILMIAVGICVLMLGTVSYTHLTLPTN